MRYFIVSDIHGEYDKLIDALSKAGFDKDKDTLISAGDAFDRGNQNLKVLNYLLSLPNKILLYGNHDMRLKRLLLCQDMISRADFHNMTINTLEELGEGKWEKALITLTEADNKNGKKLFNYFDQCCFALEFPDLYITHGWLPNVVADYNKDYCHELIKDWRNCDKEDWYNATWAHTENLIADKCFPDKPILVGHWHAFRIAKAYGEDRMAGDQVDTSTFISPDGKVIAIDGCTNYPVGQVNVYVYESDVEPIRY